MSILVNKDTRVVISGITGNTGSFHTRQCMEYGSKIVAGVTPGKGGMLFDQKVPVFNTIKESVEKRAQTLAQYSSRRHSRRTRFSRQSTPKFHS